jgi:hypothetical protein
LLVCGLSAGVVHGAEGPSFADEVQPILTAKCVSCHGREKQEGGLRLDSPTAAKAGGDRGASLVPGDVEASLLIKAITFDDPDLKMPPKQKLSEKEIATLSAWVKAGAAWPEPVVALFEDDPTFPARLSSGNGTARVVREGAFAGTGALVVTPLQRDGVKIPEWNYPIREHPNAGEYRYLRFTWKKRGAGSVMLELARDGQWPAPADPKGRYVAGPNGTGWQAISLGDSAPAEWTVATVDLWKDIGDFSLTGCAPTCDRGDEAWFDSIVLAPSISALDAYRPEATASEDATPIGDAFTDARNPIRRMFRGERLDLWSLRGPTRGDDEPRDEPVLIDQWVNARLNAAGIQPVAEADRRTLLRRLAFDLTGLPPTPEEVAKFVADTRPDAYERVVDGLLASPRYGERQARMWLDVVRYADTHGYERDEFRPLAWKYRDYVIRAFNGDKPFDRFVLEQVAGDELVESPPKSADEADALIATGFLRLGQWDSTASIFQEEDRLRAEVLADLTNTTASAFLGLTMSCCQCHDHKYDPLSQADHYRLRAFFAGVTPRDDLVISQPDEKREIDAHNARIDALTAPLRAELATLDAKKDAKDKEADKPRREELTKKVSEIDAGKRAPEFAMGAIDSGESAAPTRVLYQGDFSSPREEVAPGFVSVLFPAPAVVQPPRANTTGRRTALAKWIASPENPWTARVFVNRVWQQHFGTGLVATPNDFGFTGARPTHPELLDRLARDFADGGWSVKRLHRRIVLSATYRRDSRVAEDGVKLALTLDPENRLLWRQNVRRLDAETLRDSLLAVSGVLLPYSAGKPVWPDVPEELRHAQPAILEAEKGGDGGRMQGWYADPPEATDVRSVFLIRKRCLPLPFLQAFDLPDTTVSCARRDSTVVAPQALLLLNGPEGIRSARKLAERVLGKVSRSSDKEFVAESVVAVFVAALQRAPDKDERDLAEAFLTAQRERHRDRGDAADLAALVDLCRAAINLNEFAYID